MNKKKQRAVLIGVDGANYEAIRPLLKEGRLPNLQRLIRQGTLCTNALSTYPTLTGSNWATIATGAWPGTHGVTDMSYHLTGEPLDRWHSGFISEAIEAETIWEAVAHQGKRAIVLKYPGSWPPRDNRIIMVDGGGGRPFWGGSFLELSHSQLFTTKELPNSHKLILRPATAWQDMPLTKRVPLEGEITLIGESGNIPHQLEFGKEKKRHCKPIKLYILLTATSTGGFDTVYLCQEKNIKKVLCVLRNSEWSKSMIWTFRKNGKSMRGGVLIKAQMIDKDSGDLSLYFQQIYPVDRYTQPVALGRELVERFGVYVEHPGFSEMAMGWFDNDPETFFEIMDYQNKWLGYSARYLMENYKWDFFAMQSHCIDFANHAFIPRYGWTRKQCQKALSELSRCYESIDRMIGEVMAAAGDNAMVTIVSDHGATESPCPEILIHTILAEAGLLNFVPDSLPSDFPKIDINRSQAVPQRAAFIYINMIGREPNGIVSPEQYNIVREKVIKALREYHEPHNGENPFTMILKKEDAYILGLFDSHGRDIGDIVYALKPEFDHEHGRQLPTSTLGGQTMKPLLIFTGPGIKRNYTLERPVWLVDITPTICKMLDLSMPSEAEGAVLYQIFTEHHSNFPRRKIIDKRKISLPYPKADKPSQPGRIDREMEPMEDELMPSTIPQLQEALRKAREEVRHWKEVYDRYHRITHGN